MTELPRRQLQTLAYLPAPSHPVHHDQLVTELPFPVEVDLDALVGF
ncbi:hypothetical protein [Streptomyces doebereineriae]|uniref:Uncharacterized protein n=1 Tax=Streptomyces doebereineriae TaxID=3075528 RepID=A0ABU2VAT8_9ACTN|nr:hypothetical protein [Streptomyces sp. DSM 41640]MDT0482365.1 hypothetical protein [Streptomyces sp. DSM 41640]